ncbi:MAG: type I-B CRISPR-associated protein Cas7/Csh2 [Firmicutes bacterium]|nr:type I-B CRISPR-associated protein Cas7/Csh2 [Bacillota bacterium]
MKNSDILFLYDAKMTNPNGDPDDENRPRMDYERFRNLVSDLRLKRYIRDYLEQKGKEIFVSKLEGETVSATVRLDGLAKKLGLKGNKELTTEMVLENLMDVRLFGATMPIKAADGAKGSSMVFTGPVQFNWGYSLNEVELVESNGITSHFSSGSDKKQGAMGKDYRVYYSLLAFHGVISAYRAEHTELTEEDLELLREALVKSIPLAATRSKIGQYPRFLLQVEYTDQETLIGDLRDFIGLSSELESKKIREINDYQIDVQILIEQLDNFSEKISTLYIWQDPALQLGAGGESGLFIDLLPASLKEKIKEIL